MHKEAADRRARVRILNGGAQTPRNGMRAQQRIIPRSGEQDFNKGCLARDGTDIRSKCPSMDTSWVRRSSISALSVVSLRTLARALDALPRIHWFLGGAGAHTSRDPCAAKMAR